MTMWFAPECNSVFYRGMVKGDSVVRPVHLPAGERPSLECRCGLQFPWTGLVGRHHSRTGRGNEGAWDRSLGGGARCCGR